MGWGGERYSALLFHCSRCSTRADTCTAHGRTPRTARTAPHRTRANGDGVIAFDVSNCEASTPTQHVRVVCVRPLSILFFFFKQKCVFAHQCTPCGAWRCEHEAGGTVLQTATHMILRKGEERFMYTGTCFTERTRTT